ncbi:MAG: TatD family hydrolase [bacterium]
MIDTHAHLDFKQFDKNREKVIARCFKDGVKKIINIGYSLKIQHKNIYFAVGYHPFDIKKFDSEKLKKLAQRAVAIGEIGLDATKNNLKRQKEVFIQQLAIAKKFNLPVIIHCRKLHDEIIKFIKGHRGVVHCFAGSFKQAQKYLDLGFYLSFTGLITYDRSYDKVILNTPLEKILLETDCPFLAPAPYRHKRCEPWMMKFTAQKIAEIKNIAYNKIIKQTSNNAEKLFKI